MVQIGFNFAALLGVALALLGLSLFIVGAIRPFRAGSLVQNLVLAVVYLLAGFILFFQGWRLDPILQFTQLLLIGSSAYWVVKELFYRS
ncbi:MAG: Ycf66 family protein [Lyngbya sp. HA4199-MV5]|jgi:CHASE2 domain-containing sensor protein|nr:Ycf66 family protein [Lyngbya sp. HA4199-MV5]